MPVGLAACRDRALLLLGYAGAFRRSELVALDVVDLKFLAAGVYVWIAAAKNDPRKKGRELYVPRLPKPEICPVLALERWLEVVGSEGSRVQDLDLRGALTATRLDPGDVARILRRRAAAAGVAGDSRATPCGAASLPRETSAASDYSLRDRRSKKRRGKRDRKDLRSSRKAKRVRGFRSERGRSLMQTRTDDIVIDGRRLETVWAEPADASLPVVVMLHEGLGSVSLWKDFPQRLGQRTGYGILVYSRYGYGRSDRLAERRHVDYMHREGEVVLPELLRRLGIVKPILLGHSDGASIALIYAGSRVDGPKALILEAPHVFVEDKAVRSIAQAKVVFETGDWRVKLRRYHEDPEATFRGWNDIWLDPSFRSWNIESYLESIRCPVLVIQGQDDEYATEAQVESIVARVPGAQGVLLPRCGHSPHSEQPEETLTRIQSFLRGWST